jgi:hypothetical protein
LLGRIVDRQDDGLAQDDIEPYLLVRLLRCGYIRRPRQRAPTFVATPAGIERSALETMLTRRRQEELDRREIIRGRLQTTISRMALDYPAPPPPPTLADFRLPKLYQRESRILCPPELPMLRAGGLRVGQEAGPLAMRDARLPVDRRGAQRPTPEDALALLREGAQRATHDRELPVIIAGEVWQRPKRDLPVEHVGRLPEKGPAGVPAVREPDAPVVRIGDDTAAPPVPLVIEQFGAHGDEPLHEVESSSDATEAGDGGWGRAAIFAAVAAVAVLVAHPASRDLSTPAGPRPHSPVPQALQQATPAALAVVAAPDAAPGPSQGTSSRVAPDPVQPTPGAVLAPIPFAISTPRPVAVGAIRPVAVGATRPGVSAPRPATVTTPVPLPGAVTALPETQALANTGRILPIADVSGSAAANAAGAAKPGLLPVSAKPVPNATTAVTESTSKRTVSRPAPATEVRSSQTVAAADTPARIPQAVSAKGVPDSMTTVAGSTSKRTVSGPAPATEPHSSQTVAAAGKPAPIQLPASDGPAPNATTSDAATAPADQAPAAAILAVAETPNTVASLMAAAPALIVAAAHARNTSSAGASQPVIEATPAVATQSAATVPAAPAATPALATPSGVTVQAAPVATPAVVTQAAATVQPATAVTPVVAKSPVVAMAPAVPAPSVAASPAAAVLARPIAMATPVVVINRPEVPPPVVAAQAPVAAPAETVRFTRAADHVRSPAEFKKEKLVFASATVIARPLPPLVRRDSREVPWEDTVAAVLARLRAGKITDDAAVDRLNALSLLAARHGKTFSPRAATVSLVSTRRTATLPIPEPPPWPP